MDNTITSYDQLPLMLNAEDIVRVLRISRSAAYGLLRAKDFPTIQIGRRMVVPRDQFIEWINSQTQANTAV